MHTYIPGKKRKRHKLYLKRWVKIKTNWEQLCLQSPNKEMYWNIYLLLYCNSVSGLPPQLIHFLLEIYIYKYLIFPYIRKAFHHGLVFSNFCRSWWRVSLLRKGYMTYEGRAGFSLWSMTSNTTIIGLSPVIAYKCIKYSNNYCASEIYLVKYSNLLFI